MLFEKLMIGLLPTFFCSPKIPLYIIKSFYVGNNFIVCIYCRNLIISYKYCFFNISYNNAHSNLIHYFCYMFINICYIRKVQLKPFVTSNRFIVLNLSLWTPKLIVFFLLSFYRVFFFFLLRNIEFILLFYRFIFYRCMW